MYPPYTSKAKSFIRISSSLSAVQSETMPRRVRNKVHLQNYLEKWRVFRKGKINKTRYFLPFQLTIKHYHTYIDQGRK